MFPGTGALPLVVFFGALSVGGEAPDPSPASRTGTAATPAPLAGNAEDGEDDEDEEASEGFLGGVRFGIEADLELAYEDEGGETASEITFDEVGLSAEGAWWQTEMGVKYRSEGGTAFLVEDAAVRVGATDGVPWFLSVGRTVLPFGEFDSPFAEDPMVTLAGETDDESVVLGYEGERFEATTGLFRGDLAAADGYDVVASARARFGGDARAGLSWTSDLSEATELREIREEGAEEGFTLQGEREGIPGMSAFASVRKGRWVFYGEGVAALASLPGGFLDPERRQPAAWNLEAWFHPAPRWQIAGRLEGSHDLPRNPSRQYGVALTRVLDRHVAASVEYMHGEPGPLADTRNIVSGKLAFAF